MTSQLSTPHRPLISPAYLLALALLVVGALFVVGLYLAPQYVVATSTSTATSSEGPVSQRLAPAAQTARSGCTVTGDLVGDADPAAIAAVMCGAQSK